MRTYLRNTVCALCMLILWGNIVSLFLPPEQYGTIVKTVDFSTVLFALAVLIAVLCGIRKERKQTVQRYHARKKADGTPNSGK